MAKFRKIPVVVEAAQWNGAAPHEKVEAHFGQIIYSRDEKHFYISHRQLNPTSWVSTSGEDKDILPFAFYEVKSGRKVPLNELSGDDLIRVQDTLRKNFGVSLEELRPWGYVETLEGKMEVTEGDYIICGIKGEIYPCREDIFEATYEPADVETTYPPEG